MVSYPQNLALLYHTIINTLWWSVNLSDNWAFNFRTVNFIKTPTTVNTQVNCNMVCLFWDSVCIVTGWSINSHQHTRWYSQSQTFHTLSYLYVWTLWTLVIDKNIDNFGWPPASKVHYVWWYPVNFLNTWIQTKKVLWHKIHFPKSHFKAVDTGSGVQRLTSYCYPPCVVYNIFCCLDPPNWTSLCHIFATT